MERSPHFLCLVVIFAFICKCHALPAVSDNDFRTMRTRFEKFVLLQGQQIKLLQETVAKLEAKLGQKTEQEAKVHSDIKDDYNNKLNAAVGRLENSMSEIEEAVAKMEAKLEDNGSKNEEDSKIWQSLQELESKLSMKFDEEAAKAAASNQETVNKVDDGLTNTIGMLHNLESNLVEKIEQTATKVGSDGDQKLAECRSNMEAKLQQVESKLSDKIDEQAAKTASGNEEARKKLDEDMSDLKDHISAAESQIKQLSSTSDGNTIDNFYKLKIDMLDTIKAAGDNIGQETKKTLDNLDRDLNSKMSQLEVKLEDSKESSAKLNEALDKLHEDIGEKLHELEVKLQEKLDREEGNSKLNVAMEALMVEMALKLNETLSEFGQSAAPKMDHEEVDSKLASTVERLQNNMTAAFEGMEVLSAWRLDAAIERLENIMSGRLEGVASELETKLAQKIGDETTKVAINNKEDSESKLTEAVEGLEETIEERVRSAVAKLEASLEQKMTDEASRVANITDSIRADDSKLAQSVGHLESNMTELLKQTMSNMEAKLEERIGQEKIIAQEMGNSRVAEAVENLGKTMTDNMHQVVKDLEETFERRIGEEAIKVALFAEDGDAKVTEYIERFKESMTDTFREAVTELEERLERKIGEETNKLAVNTEEGNSKLTEDMQHLKETMTETFREAVTELEDRLERRIGEEATSAARLSEEASNSKLTEAVDRLKEMMSQETHKAAEDLERSLVQKIGEETSKVLRITEESNSKLTATLERLEKDLLEMVDDAFKAIDSKQEQRLDEEATKIAMSAEEKSNSTLADAMDRLKDNFAEMLRDVVDKMSARLEEKMPEESPIHFRNCEEIRSDDASKESGTYTIDPDGHGVGEEPIQVFCDMTTGTTIISHDSQDQTNATRCLLPGCYSRPIVYEASMKQISALIQRSTECRQMIEYDCYAAPLHFNGVSQSWWNDNKGQRQYYWAGSDSSQHTCQCGIDGNCFEPSMRCNCDSNFPMELSDTGFITNKTALPVTQLNFGRTWSAWSVGKHRLGKLECSGTESFQHIPTSCEDLKKDGHSLNGIYTVKAASGVRSVFCDMTKLPGEKGLEVVIGNLNADY